MHITVLNGTLKLKPFSDNNKKIYQLLIIILFKVRKKFIHLIK